MDVRDLLLRRRGVMMQKKSSSVDNYITDGLVFHLDGSDAVAGEWVDRIGGLTYSLHGAYPDGNGGVVFLGEDHCYGNCPEQVNVQYNEGTIEVVANGSGQSRYGIFAQPQTTKIAFLVFSTNYVSFSQIVRHKRYYAQTSGMHTLSVSLDRMYKDGVVCNESGQDNFTSPNVRGSYIGNGGYSAYKYKGTLYQIRIYDRILSAEEVVFNQNIDINKYNITI